MVYYLALYHFFKLYGGIVCALNKFLFGHFGAVFVGVFNFDGKVALITAVTKLFANSVKIDFAVKGYHMLVVDAVVIVYVGAEKSVTDNWQKIFAGGVAAFMAYIDAVADIRLLKVLESSDEIINISDVFKSDFDVLFACIGYKAFKALYAAVKIGGKVKIRLYVYYKGRDTQFNTVIKVTLHKLDVLVTFGAFLPNGSAAGHNAVRGLTFKTEGISKRFYLAHCFDVIGDVGVGKIAFKSNFLGGGKKIKGIDTVGQL